MAQKTLMRRKTTVFHTCTEKQPLKSSKAISQTPLQSNHWHKISVCAQSMGGNNNASKFFLLQKLD